jgi:hypothetical protein
VVRGTMAVGRSLTALVAGVTQWADNNSGRSGKRSYEAAQEQVHHKGTQEVEERSRWRWSLRRFGVHRNQDKFIPSQRGTGHPPAGPLSRAHLYADRAVVLRFGT